MIDAEGSRVSESSHSSAIRARLVRAGIDSLVEPVESAVESSWLGWLRAERNEGPNWLRHRRTIRKTVLFILASAFLVWGGLWWLQLLGVDESLADTATYLIGALLMLWVLVFVATAWRKWRHLHRIFEPTWTYLFLFIVLLVSVLLAIPIVQGGDKNEGGTEFIEVRIAAIFTLATFIPVVIALFLQGKPSMRIERGWVVWRSSFGVATGFYAVLLFVAGVVAIFEIALAGGVADWVAYLGVVTFFLVILMLPVLLVSVAVCSGAPYTSDSAANLVWARLISKKEQKAKRLIKDLRDVTIVEYKQDNRRAVRARLKALRDILKNDDWDIKQVSLEEIGFVATEMILDRDLAQEAIEALLSKSTNQQPADPRRWRELVDTQVSELMSIWATAVEKKASPLLVEMCADKVRDILRDPDVYEYHGFFQHARKLNAIIAAYEDTEHEETGLLLTLSIFGHFVNFPDAVLDRLSEGSKSPVEDLTKLLLDTDRPDRLRYEKYVWLFIKKSDNLPSRALSRSIPFSSLRELAKKSEEHRKLIANSCHWYVTDPDTDSTTEATETGYLALVLKVVRQSAAEDLPDEDKENLLTWMQAKAGGRKFRNWEPSQFRSIVTPNLMQLLPEKVSYQLSAEELASDETLPALRDVVLQLLVRSWGAHLEEQSESASESDKANQQWLLGEIRQYTRSLPSDKADRFESVTEGLSSQLEKYNQPLFAELSSFDVFASIPQFEDQKNTLAKAYVLYEELTEQNIPASNYFDGQRWTFADKKVLLEGLATTLLNAEENVAKGRLPLDKQIRYRDKRIRVSDAKEAVVKIAMLVCDASGGEGHKVLHSLTQGPSASVAASKMRELMKGQH